MVYFTSSISNGQPYGISKTIQEWKKWFMLEMIAWDFRDLFLIPSKPPAYE